MNLHDVIRPAQIVLPLPGGSLVEASGALLDCLVQSGCVRDADKLRRRLSEDRAEDLVALGDRAFILHYRTDAVSELRVALGVAPEPLARPREDDGPRARVVLMSVAPLRQAARHLQVVRGFARLFSRDESVAAVLQAGDAASLAALPLFAEYTLPEQLTVRDLMTERPRTTGPDLPLREAARELLDAGLAALPVVDEDGRLLGLLSERELMRHLLSTEILAGPSGRHAGPAAQARRTVRDVMTRQVLCVAPEQSVAEVAALMTNKDVERLPVVREGRLVGFLTRGDIVRKLIGP